MAGIYGSNQEDKHFENELLNTETHEMEFEDTKLECEYCGVMYEENEGYADSDDNYCSESCKRTHRSEY